jgi:hypothetical protein
VIEEVIYVLHLAASEVVHAQHLVIIFHECVTEVASDEARSSGDERRSSGH